MSFSSKNPNHSKYLMYSFKLGVSAFLLTASFAYAESKQAVKNERSDRSDFEAKMTQTTQEELNLVKTDLKKELSSAQEKLTGIKKSKEKITQDLVALSASEEKGIAFLNKYSQLIQFKYIDKDGIFDPKAELSQKDVNIINSIFNNYLHSQPLQGKTTTSIALDQISKGIASVQQLIAVHSKPEVTNNSDLAILTKDEETAQKRVTVLQDLVAKLDSPTGANDQRMPASQK